MTDAHGITINYSPADSPMDALHRVTKKTSSDGSVTAVYVYDQAAVWGVNLSNPIGRLVLANTGNAAELFSYDVLGRPLRTYDCTPKNMADQTGCYTVDARYDLAGNLTSLTYPNGQRLSYSSCGPNSRLPKPDFVAQVPFPTLCRERPFAGTSAAAPQAAALAALVWARHPGWSASQVRAALRGSARDLEAPGHDWETGFGLIHLPGN